MCDESVGLIKRHKMTQKRRNGVLGYMYVPTSATLERTAHVSSYGYLSRWMCLIPVLLELAAHFWTYEYLSTRMYPQRCFIRCRWLFFVIWILVHTNVPTSASLDITAHFWSYGYLITCNLKRTQERSKGVLGYMHVPISATLDRIDHLVISILSQMNVPHTNFARSRCSFFDIWILEHMHVPQRSFIRCRCSF